MSEFGLLFDLPPIIPERTTVRRRSRTLSIGDENISCRSERLTKRNKTMLARYYYWTEIKRRRFDDVLRILSDNEFFVDERTINNALVGMNEYYTELCRTKPTLRKLSQLYPGFDWSK